MDEAFHIPLKDLSSKLPSEWRRILHQIKNTDMDSDEKLFADALSFLTGLFLHPKNSNELRLVANESSSEVRVYHTSDKRIRFTVDIYSRTKLYCNVQIQLFNKRERYKDTILSLSCDWRPTFNPTDMINELIKDMKGQMAHLATYDREDLRKMNVPHYMSSYMGGAIADELNKIMIARKLPPKPF